VSSPLPPAASRCGFSDARFSESYLSTFRGTISVATGLPRQRELCLHRWAGSMTLSTWLGTALSTGEMENSNQHSACGVRRAGHQRQPAGPGAGGPLWCSGQPPLAESGSRERELVSSVRGQIGAGACSHSGGGGPPKTRSES
jgi:hypothetical protein